MVNLRSSVLFWSESLWNRGNRKNRAEKQSPDRWFELSSLLSCCFLRQETLPCFVSLHPTTVILIFILFSSAKDDYNIDKESYHSLTISSDGNISRFFPTIYKSSCNLDVTNFPFDDQVTSIEFVKHALGL